MALPVISHNNPVAGSISWTAFAITYGGVSYSVAASNTANKFVYWQYNGGSPVLVGTDTLPNDLAPEDLLLFLNKTGVGMLVPEANVVDGSLIVAGSVYAQAIAADQINATHILAGSVNATHIDAGAIEAEHISAGAITADKLSVGTVSDNMVVNGSFEDALSGTLVGWEANSLVNGTITPVTGQSSSGAVSMQVMATTTAANLRFRQLPAQYIPVSSASSRKYYVSCRAGATVATTVGHYMRVNWYDANKAFISSNDVRANAALTTTFTLYEGQVTPPATAKYMGMETILLNPNVVTTLYVDEISAHEVTMAAQIGDGQITTAKLVAGAVTTGILGAGAVTADKMLVTDRTNYWENPDFEGDTVGQQPKGIVANTSCRVIASGAGGSGKALEMDAKNGSNNDTYGLQTFPVTPGDKYYIKYDYQFLNNVGTGLGGVGFRTYGPTKAAVSWTNAAPTVGRPLTWTAVTPAVYTVPAGVYFLQPWVTFANNAETTNRFQLDNIVIRRMSGGELIVDGAIVADKIAANAVSSTHIAAGAVTANKLLIGDFENLATINEVHGLTVTSYGQTQIVGGYNSLVTDSGSFFMFKDQAGPVPFKNTEELHYSFTAKATNATTAQFGTWIYNAAAQVRSTATTAFNIGTTDTVISGTLVVPATDDTWGPAKQWVCGLQSVANKGIQVKDVVVRRRHGGELLVDGSIIAGKIATGAVVAGKIATDAVTANTIAAGAITATKIATDAIEATHISATAIDGMTITGATIIGGEVKTTETASAVAARMGPVGAYDPWDDAVKPGIGFVVNGSLDNPAGMYTRTGSELVLSQGKADASNFQYADITLDQSTMLLRSADTVTIDSYNDVVIGSDFGDTAISGGVNVDITGSTGVNVTAGVNGFKVNGHAVGFNNYLEYANTQTGFPNATLWGPGQPASNSRSTTSTGMANWSANDTLMINQNGIYTISYTIYIGAGATGRSFCGFSMSYDVRQIARASAAIGEDTITATATFRINSGETVVFTALQTTGATRTVDNRIRVTRVSDV